MNDDQKRALGFGGVAVAGILIYRRMHSGTQQVAGPQLVSPSGSTEPYTPQAPLPLEPGQSVYDPNSEGLLNTPAALANAPQPTTPSAPGYTVNVNYPKPATTTPTTTKPATRKVGSAAGPHGAIVARPGPKPPPAKKGYTTVGTGHGGWIYKPIKKAA